MLETSVPPQNDTGEEDISGLVHVFLVAWVDTTRCAVNADLLPSIAHAEAAHLELLELLYAAQGFKNSFAPSYVKHKILVFTEVTSAYICRQVSGALSSCENARQHGRHFSRFIISL